MLIKIKILAVLIAITFAGVIISSPRFTSTLASGDRIIEQIKHYKGWKKITPEPFAVSHKSSADESPDIIWFDTSGFG